MPERLNRLIIYPFSWYGRTLWQCIKVFIDPRTQDKVLLFAAPDAPTIPPGCTRVPEEVAKYINLDDIPVCCGGTNTDPPIDILSTLQSP